MFNANKGMTVSVTFLWIGILVCSLFIGNGVARMDGETVLYASPSGSGAVCSEALPCSLEGARDKVRTINDDMNGDIVVLLRGGTYARTAPFELTESIAVHDSGTNGYNVIYRAYPDETPVLSGGESIPGTAWTLHDSVSNIYKADVGSLDTRQLYVNGQRAVRARGEMFPAGFVRTTTGYTLPSGGPYAGMAGWDNKGDIEAVIFYQWKSLRCPVNSISGSALTMQDPCWTLLSPATTAPAPTWIENAYELLDEEGEWYLDLIGAVDGNAGTLYYKPRAGETMATAEVVAGSTAETLLKGTGTDIVVEPPADPEPSYNNAALGQTVTAASYWGASLVPGNAVDGNPATAWASMPPYTTPPWWQVDLGSAQTIAKIELMTRQDNVDHVYERKNFEVLASNDPTFATYTVLGRLGEFTAFGYKSTWTQYVDDSTPYRYVRVAKTDNITMIMAELRVLVEAGP